MTDYLSGLLEQAGFEVDRAFDGRRGLELALTGGYSALVLETVLPELEGLELLRTARRLGVTTPAIVLTGSPTIDSAIEATRLGATYLNKAQTAAPTIAAAIRTVTASTSESRRSPLFATTEKVIPVLGHGVNGAGRLLLVRLLLDPGVTFPQFVRAASALRLACTPDARDTEARLDTVCTPRPPWTDVDPLARTGIFRIEQAGAHWGRLTEELLADQLSVRPATLWRLLKDQFGLDFRECRRAVVMRRATRELSAGDEHVAQIGYSLGYEHPSSFDRDFRRFLGITPTRFRRLTREESDKNPVKNHSLRHAKGGAHTPRARR